MKDLKGVNQWHALFAEKEVYSGLSSLVPVAGVAARELAQVFNGEGVQWPGYLDVRLK